ncbi:hypothetical protein EZS27_014958 [termite gut metagenome]|uniref:KAP NTPase domain-containing protein n=1 Tax=termite gut metagenome TaxID=433724 RepID=A0A5J4RSL0_9ZZZZ
MSTFERFQLKTNPFRMTPAINTDELIWAGFPIVKEKFENRIKRSIQIPNSSLILNWGEYGSGKTHAARYFNKLSVLQDLAGATQPIPLSLFISFPNSKQPITDIYTQIIDKLDINELRENLKNKGVDVSTILDLVTDNIFMRNVLKLMFDETIDATFFKGYLYRTSFTNSDLRTFAKNGVQRTFSTDNDLTEFLAALFSLIAYQKIAYSCVILWFDEFESISILSSINITAINNFLRTIIDKTPNNLLIFLNLTQSAMMDTEDLGEYLHEAVKNRIKEKIELSIPTPDELKSYLKELLNNTIHRDNLRNDCYPFEDDIINALISDLGNASLRAFNEAFSVLLESAAFDNREIIDKTYYESIKNEIIGWK